MRRWTSTWLELVTSCCRGKSDAPWFALDARFAVSRRSFVGSGYPGHWDWQIRTYAGPLGLADPNLCRTYNFREHVCFMGPERACVRASPKQG